MSPFKLDRRRFGIKPKGWIDAFAPSLPRRRDTLTVNAFISPGCYFIITIVLVSRGLLVHLRVCFTMRPGLQWGCWVLGVGLTVLDISLVMELQFISLPPAIQKNLYTLHANKALLFTAPTCLFSHIRGLAWKTRFITLLQQQPNTSHYQ